MLESLIHYILEFPTFKTSMFIVLLLVTICLLPLLDGRKLRVGLAVIVIAALLLAVIDDYGSVFGPGRGTFWYQVNSFVFGVLLIPPTNMVMISLMVWMVTRSPEVVGGRKAVIIPILLLSLLFELSFLAVMHVADDF